MHVHLGEGDLDACGVQGFFAFLQEIEIHVPVIGGFDPYADGKDHAAFAQLDQTHFGQRIGQHPVAPGHQLPQGMVHQGKIALITDGKGNVQAAAALPDGLLEWTVEFPDEEEEDAEIQAGEAMEGEGLEEAQGLQEDLREKALSVLEGLPDADTCLHGDLHIGNIITDGKRVLWIDVGDFAYGCPEWDLSMLFHASTNLTPERAESIFHLKPEDLRKHWEIFSREYFGTTDQAQLKNYEVSLLPYLGLKLIFLISKLHGGRGPFSEGITQFIRNSLGLSS